MKDDSPTKQNHNDDELPTDTILQWNGARAEILARRAIATLRAAGFRL